MRMRQADLYLLLRCYARTYCGSDEEMYSELFERADMVMNTYRHDYPGAVPIDQFRNARDAGRHKVYTDELDSEIIELFRYGVKQTDIATQKHCSKSYVSKMNYPRASLNRPLDG